eukprot:TRINITY_DN67589_c4_g4_i1.p1 TRINITY_DN67589_c4_g4~~TRINITY_DN67589_c4_g4_i1.p1  ORF type:complete len:309 (-),score=28.63 TRINITY_DN67589_c4_g4_i1:1223-2149(-)
MEQHLSPVHDLLDNAFDEFSKALEKVQNEVQTHWLTFKQRKTELATKITECKEVADETKMISLNVGGTVFTTSERTLLHQVDTFFWAMLHSGQWEPDTATGQYLIDRSPKMFELVLEFLRTGQIWNFHDMSAGEREMLSTELDFYGISFCPPTTTLCWDPTSSKKESDKSFSLSEDTHTLLVHTGSIAGGRAIATQPFPCGDTVHFTLSVKATPVDLGHPSFWFGDFGLALHNGNWSFDGGVTWQPAMKRSVNNGNLKFEFIFNKHTMRLVIVGPAEDTRTVTIPKTKPVVNCTISCPSAKKAAFFIE